MSHSPSFYRNYKFFKEKIVNSLAKYYTQIINNFERETYKRLTLMFVSCMLLRAKSLFFRAQGLGSREQGIVLAQESFSHNQKIPSFVKGDVCQRQTGGFSTNSRFINNLHCKVTNYMSLRAEGVASSIFRDKRLRAQEVRSASERQDDKRVVERRDEGIIFACDGSCCFRHCEALKTS